SRARRSCVPRSSTAPEPMSSRRRTEGSFARWRRRVSSTRRGFSPATSRSSWSPQAIRRESAACRIFRGRNGSCSERRRSRSGRARPGHGARLRGARPFARRPRDPVSFRVPVSRRAWNLVQIGATALLVTFLLLPVAALALTLGWRDFLAGIRHPLLAPALRLSLTTSSSSLMLVVVLGSLVAWWVARHRGPLARAIETVTQLPAVIPPAVAGVGLLLAFGRR